MKYLGETAHNWGEIYMIKTDQEKAGYILSLLEKIQYGSVTIIIQDGKIIQLDVTEKHRLSK